MVTVTIHNTNTDRPIYSTLEVKNGRAVTHGDFHIDGVPGTGAPIRLDFRDGAGGRTGSLLPTGHVRDTFKVAGLGEVEASVVDIANLVVFAPAETFGLTGTEDPVALENNQQVMDQVESLHEAVAIGLGLAPTPGEASKEIVPFVSLVAPPQDWIDYATREKRAADSCDFVVRGFAAHRAHKAYFGTGSACIAVAAALPGSVVHDVTRKQAIESGVFRLGHPTGTIRVEAELAQSHGSGSYEVRRAELLRTARKLMDGRVYVSADRLRKGTPLHDSQSLPEWWTHAGW
jgi:methylitaconate Delta-isomerase